MTNTGAARAINPYHTNGDGDQVITIVDQPDHAGGVADRDWRRGGGGGVAGDPAGGGAGHRPGRLARGARPALRRQAGRVHRRQQRGGGYHGRTVPIASDTLGQPLPSRENRFRRAFLLVFVLGITALFLERDPQLPDDDPARGDLRGPRLSAVHAARAGVQRAVARWPRWRRCWSGRSRWSAPLAARGVHGHGRGDPAERERPPLDRAGLVAAECARTAASSGFRSPSTCCRIASRLLREGSASG